jgi:hypothetical protein
MVVNAGSWPRRSARASAMDPSLQPSPGTETR